jgi:hypothetical protein
MMFSVGQKVVCIDDGVYEDAAPFLPCRPRAGKIYTIASIHIEPGLEGYGLRFEECPNPEIAWSDGDECEWSFHSRRFRPLSEAEATANAMEVA